MYLKTRPPISDFASDDLSEFRIDVLAVYTQTGRRRVGPDIVFPGRTTGGKFYWRGFSDSVFNRSNDDDINNNIDMTAGLDYTRAI